MKTPPFGGVLSFGDRSHLGAEFAESRVFVELFEIDFAREVFLAGRHVVAEDADQDERADQDAVEDGNRLGGG